MTLSFDSQTEYVLEDERVLLRPLKETDLEFLIPYVINEPDTWRYFGFGPKGEDGMRAFVGMALKKRTEGITYPFIVFDKQSNEYAGSTSFLDILPDFQALQLGSTWYGEKFRGTGLNKHCKFLLLQFAFETLNAVRVEFRADARNEKSIAAMKSIGCTVEGILRSNMPLQDGTRRNSIVLSILKDEWENGVKEKLEKRLIR